MRDMSAMCRTIHDPAMRLEWATMSYIKNTIPGVLTWSLASFLLMRFASCQEECCIQPVVAETCRGQTSGFLSSLADLALQLRRCSVPGEVDWTVLGGRLDSAVARLIDHPASPLFPLLACLNTLSL